MRDVDAQELPSTEGFSFTGFLAKPTDVRAWNIQVRYKKKGPATLSVNVPKVYSRQKQNATCTNHQYDVDIAAQPTSRVPAEHNNPVTLGNLAGCR